MCVERPFGPTPSDRYNFLELFLQSDVVNESTIKRMVLQFEKRALKNQEMRIKFPDAPEK